MITLKRSVYLQYLDANNLYGYAICRLMDINGVILKILIVIS